MNFAAAPAGYESLPVDLVASFLGALAAALLAYWFTRRSWRAQERRMVYAAFVRATAEFLEACGPWLHACLHEKTRSTHPEERDRMHTALREMKVSVREIALVGTEPIAEHASRMVGTALDIADMAQADEAQMQKLAEERAPIVYFHASAVDHLVGMMRVEIGTDSLSGSLQALVLRRRYRRMFSEVPPRSSRVEPPKARASSDVGLTKSRAAGSR
ncbi:hypothetical protein [Humibacillus xanthopallidus]|uniref:hypothetical protein n=1 Tax=Humibacillus xanthopallidus TaxID=412689 RepID=UPI00114EBE64|nr:hypothetical protein [Humibacillus xanthopallidus]